MKRIAAAAVLGALSLLALAGCKSMTTEELKGTMEITDIETKWVMKYYQPWPPRLILVPQLSFRVKNIGTQPLTFVNFNGVYNFKGEAENFGDCFLSAIRGKAVPVGEKSDVITLKSNLGVDGKNLANIRDNPAWKTAEVRLFARSKGSQFVLLGIYDVSRYIDFKEPEPLAPKQEGIKK